MEKDMDDFDERDDEDEDEEIVLERICQNCSYFFSNSAEDYEQGVCIREEAFLPYIDEIIQKNDFSCCLDLYHEKCMPADRPACDEYDEIEILSEEEWEAEVHREKMRTADVSEFAEKISDADPEIRLKASDILSYCACYGNEDARRALVDSYNALGPAETIDEVNIRIKLINDLRFLPYSSDIVEALLQEFYRTPSNNTTRKLHRKVLKFLDYYPYEMIKEPLEELLRKKKLGPRMREHVLDLLIKETDFFLF
ncbi:MAG: hypothetical protein KBG64_06085 [Clostridia bacterium]|nr:hypothetical protein [Clostridia bacterium]